MDVDLLRPGTVPISPETVLWFEFLLDKNLLLKHLEKPTADPTPIELINKFTIAIFESFKNEVKRPEVEGCDPIILIGENNTERLTTKYSKKSIALKILSLKVAAFIKWDLIELMTLPFKVQVNVLQDLLYFTNKHTFIEIPNVENYDLNIVSKEFLFALLMYYRWLISTCMRRIFCQIPSRLNGEMTPMEESYFCTDDNIEKSLTFLNNALTWKEIPLMLSFECFVMLTENNEGVEHDWQQAQYISRNEFSAQINYELGCFYFYRENYDLAKLHFQNTLEFYNQIIDKVGFANFKTENLEGYVVACRTQTDGSNRNLLHAFSVCVANQYMGILNVFLEDNKYREIPLNHRINLELDIIAAQSSGKFAIARDLLPKIQSLNAIRCVLEQKGTHNYNFISEKNQDFLVWAALAVWDHISMYEKKLLSTYFLQLAIAHKIPDLLKKAASQEKLQNIINDDLICAYNESANDVKIPALLENSCWDFPELNIRRNPKLEIRTLEHQLIINYDPIQIRDLLVKVTMKNTNRAIWKLNPKWELPIPLQSVIASLPRGFLQDYGFVLLAKAREMTVAKDWTTSLVLLRALENEIQHANADLPHITKLHKLVGWEILLVEVTQLLEECPAPPIDKQTLANSCKACLETNDSVLPRTEVTEQCVLCLLNLGYWDFFVNLDKRFIYFELGKAIAIACQDLNKYKGPKKFSKDLWDLTLPAFIMPPSQSKKTNSGGGSLLVHREIPVNNTKMTILSFFSRLRDGNALRVVISLLTKLYNVLRDEASLELNVEYGNLWPAVVSNANSYVIEAVSEVLLQIVDQALKFYPYNVSWLRLIGDINFVEEKFENALNYYLKSLIICNEYFNIPIRQDDHIYRRMIKSCASLGYYTQAAVLCQFLDEPDYLSAFRFLSEQKNCNDAVDAYYNYFWDTNILEFLIHIHQKKGEFHRRKKAVEIMGLLELNANNNDEILREASNHRKSTFLRALCKQFVY